MRQLLSFGLVGCVGFLVDASVLYLMLWLGAGLYFGRIISYLSAVTVTWLLNRRFTFTETNTLSPLQQWGRFALSQLLGAAVNLGTYSALVATSPFCSRLPVVAVGAGSLSGLIINFFVARRFVFNAAAPLRSAEP